MFISPSPPHATCVFRRQTRFQVTLTQMQLWLILEKRLLLNWCCDKNLLKDTEPFCTPPIQGSYGVFLRGQHVFFWQFWPIYFEKKKTSIGQTSNLFRRLDCVSWRFLQEAPAYSKYGICIKTVGLCRQIFYPKVRQPKIISHTQSIHNITRCY